MRPARRFLGWDRPLLSSAVARVLEERGSEATARGVLRLDDALWVVPGRRAARRLLERLVLDAREAGLEAVAPPTVVTPGSLPELLLPSEETVAGPLHSLLAWIEALQSAPEEVLSQVLGARAGDRDWARLLEVARSLERFESELAVEELTIREAASVCRRRLEFPEEARWQALEELARRRGEALASDGVVDVHSARRRAVTAGRTSGRFSELALVGVTELPRFFRRVLATAGIPVSCWIQAPEELAECFDDWGCPHCESWLERPLALDKARLHVVDRPADQVAEVVGVVKAWRDAGAPARAVSVGLGDTGNTRALQDGLDLVGVVAHAPAGRLLSGSRPARLLEVGIRYLEGQRVSDLAILVRHPDVEPLLGPPLPPEELEAARSPEARRAAKAASVGDWATVLDLYTEETLVERVSSPLPGDSFVARLVAHLDETVAELMPGGASRARSGSWIEGLASLLERAYGDRDLDLDDGADAELVEALSALGAALRECADLGASAERALPTNPGDLLALLLSRLEELRAPGDSLQGSAEESVELLGWLELPLDDAPLLAVTDLNEGVIPEALASDPFLPDRARAVLGLLDDRRRTARDSFLLQATVESRSSVALFACRRGADDEPLLPSRLLLSEARSGDADALARRLADFYRRDEKGGTVALPWSHGPSLRLRPPRPGDAPLPERLRVTSLRDYLRCPFRFYLKHVLGLRALEDQPRELDAAAFGSLAHQVLGDFARGAAAASGDAERIGRELETRLRERARDRFGARPPAAVRVQLVRLERRLGAFARWQADQVREGWRLVPELCEERLETRVEVDGRSVAIVGRIDRVELHDAEGYRILDYKTGDRGPTPESTHRMPRGSAQGELGGWRDLQLPLYELLLRERLGGGLEGEPVALGFCRLDAASATEPLALAEWSPAERAEACDVAVEVVRRIVAREFWPPGQPPRWPDGLEWLCWDEMRSRGSAA